ncbi:lysophospholipase [Daedaleopsis nitida]|nr:lysophospholipase [Daedaleopsis nitida]
MPNSTYTEAWLAGPDGHSFYTRTYQAPYPKAVLIFAHGFRDHIGRYADLHAALARRHVSVFAYDLRGYGRTALDPSNRSPEAGYGKTTRALELRDMEWWVRHVAGINRRLPLFLMGYSGGGGLSMVFPTRTEAPPFPETVGLLSGIIAVSPLVKLGAHSRDPAVVSAMENDPLIKTQGRAQAMWEMLAQGEEMLETGWQRWPQDLPFIMLWGTENEVNSPKAGIDLFDKIAITDKKLVTYQDALDDLAHESGDVPQRFLDDCIAWIEAHLDQRQPTPHTTLR